MAASDFVIKPLRENKIKIQLSSSDDYRAVTKYYDSCKISYFSFVNPEDAKLSVVIKPLPLSLTEDEIKESLADMSYPVHSVTRLYNREKEPSFACAVLLTNDTKGKAIFDLKKFSQCIVSVEPRRRSKQIPQCMNCLRFNHTKNYCRLEPRCLRCAEPHLFKDCPYRGATSSQVPAPKCSNCGGQHVASYRGCEAHRKLKEILKKSRQPQVQKPRYAPAPPQMNSAWDWPLLPCTEPQQPSSSPPEQPSVRPKSARPATTPKSQQPSPTTDLSSVVVDLIKKVIEPLLPKITDFLKSFISSIISPFNG